MRDPYQMYEDDRNRTPWHDLLWVIGLIAFIGGVYLWCVS